MRSPLADIVQRSRPVVPVLAEVLRNEGSTHYKECSEARKKHEDQR